MGRTALRAFCHLGRLRHQRETRLRCCCTGPARVTTILLAIRARRRGRTTSPAEPPLGVSAHAVSCAARTRHQRDLVHRAHHLGLRQERVARGPGTPPPSPSSRALRTRAGSRCLGPAAAGAARRRWSNSRHRQFPYASCRAASGEAFPSRPPLHRRAQVAHNGTSQVFLQHVDRLIRLVLGAQCLAQATQRIVPVQGKPPTTASARSPPLATLEPRRGDARGGWRWLASASNQTSNLPPCGQRT